MGRCRSHASSSYTSFVVFTKIFFCSASIPLTTNNRDISTLYIFIKSLFRLYLSVVGSSSIVTSSILPRSQNFENDTKDKDKIYSCREKIQTYQRTYTAWKVSKYGVFSGPCLETFHTVITMKRFSLHTIYHPM